MHGHHGHGVPPELLERADQLWRAFFDEPIDRKMACAPPDPTLLRGFYGITGLGDAYNQGNDAPPDLREFYMVNRIDALPAAYLEGVGPARAYLEHPNIWPARPDGLREASEACYRAMERLALRLMEIFAVALDLSPDYFADKLDKHHSTLGVASYPDQRTPPHHGRVDEPSLAVACAPRGQLAGRCRHVEPAPIRALLSGAEL